MASRVPIHVEVVRGNVIESTHQVMAVVTDHYGNVVTSWGNPLFYTYPRSAIKMLQAIPLIETGAADKYQLDNRMLALACASHRGEKEHIDVARAWLEKINMTEEVLLCGPHPATHEPSRDDMIMKKIKPTKIYNNCIGKHLGIVTTSLHLKEDFKNYDKHDHAVQKRLRKVLTETTKYEHSKSNHGIDGCGILTYALPIQNMSTGMSALINPKETPLRQAACKRLLSAIRDNPEIISGHDDFTTEVIRKTQGRTIIKNGAEGVFCGVIPEKNIAFAIKALDGASRAAQVATAAILFKYGGLNQTEFTDLKRFTQPLLKNWNGTDVGSIRIGKE